MKSKLVFIRHGQSLGNVNRDYYKLPDPAVTLTEKGVLQSVEVMNKLPEILKDIDDYEGNFTTVLTSQFQRAKTTAQIATSGLSLRVPIIHDSRLNEAYFHHSDDLITETRSQIKFRMSSLLNQYPFHLIMFTHGQFMQTFEPEKPRPKNCEIRIYDRDEFVKNNLCFHPMDFDKLEH